MADTNINSFQARSFSAGDYVFVGGSDGVGPRRVPITELIRPGTNLTQSAVNAATGAGAGFLAALVYNGDFDGRPTTGLTAGQIALFAGVIDGYPWRGLFSWTGDRWTPLSPVTAFSWCGQTGATGVNSVTTEQWLKSVLIPNGLLTCCSRFVVDGFFAKNGVATTASVQTRLGNSLTSSDTQLSSVFSIATSSRNSFIKTELYVDSPTSIIGVMHPYGALATTSGVAAPRVLTTSDLSNPTYVSWTASLGAAGSDTPSLVSGSVVLLP